MKSIKWIMLLLGFLEVVSFIIFNKKINTLNTNSNIIADISLDNNYYKNLNFNFVQNTNIDFAYNKQDLLNIFYTSLNNGLDSFTFKCSNTYSDCSKDIVDIFSKQNALVINNLVSPFNSYYDLKISYLGNNKFKISIIKLYSKEEINSINKQIDYILSKIITNNMTNEEKIVNIHNYILNNTVYNDITNSNKAVGVLFNGQGLCSGYADTLALFLEKIDVPNYKVVSDNHVWNVVYINNRWLHIDNTLDESEFNGGYNSYNFFLIDTDYLNSYKLSEHNFNKDIYSELV